MNKCVSTTQTLDTVIAYTLAYNGPLWGELLLRDLGLHF